MGRVEEQSVLCAGAPWQYSSGFLTPRSSSGTGCHPASLTPISLNPLLTLPGDRICWLWTTGCDDGGVLSGTTTTRYNSEHALPGRRLQDPTNPPRSGLQIGNKPCTLTQLAEVDAGMVLLRHAALYPRRLLPRGCSRCSQPSIFVTNPHTEQLAAMLSEQLAAVIYQALP